MEIVAVTGHRSEKIPNEHEVREAIAGVFKERRVDVVINGLANGVDLWAAYAAIDADIEVWSAKPWAGHSPRKADRELYDFVVNNSKVHIVNDSQAYPGPWVYQKRNEWMVDNANKVFAVWDGTPGGTENCFNYALKVNKPILRLFPNTLVRMVYAAEE